MFYFRNKIKKFLGYVKFIVEPSLILKEKERGARGYGVKKRGTQLKVFPFDFNNEKFIS